MRRILDSTTRMMPLFTMLLLVALVGCDRQTRPETKLTNGEDLPQVRLVTLSPALTKMVIDLGQKDLIVATARNDNAAPENLPTVGDVLDLNTEALLRARPTHVISMSIKDGDNARLAELARRNNFMLATYPSPLNLDEVGRIIFDEMELTTQGSGKSVRSLGQVLGVPLAASKVKLRMLTQLAQLSELTSHADRPRVLLILASNPVVALGPDTVHSQVLNNVNATNAVADASVGAPSLDREKLITAAPDIVLFLSPGGAPVEDLATDARFVLFRDLDIPAVKNNRVVVLGDPLILLPASNVAHIAADMAKAVHPDLAEKVDAVMARESLALRPEGSPVPVSTPADNQVPPAETDATPDAQP